MGDFIWIYLIYLNCSYCAAHEYEACPSSLIEYFACLSSGMKTPLGPSQLLESGPILAFGGMCHELMDRPTPTSASPSVQQTPSAGD